MRIAIGSDHAGYELKSAVGTLLAGDGHDVEDVGTDSTESVDYPDFAAAAAEMVAEGEADRAVIVCGSGVGVSIVANKLEGIRAVNAHDPDEAEMSRRHNDANVPTLSSARLAPRTPSRSSSASWKRTSTVAAMPAAWRRSPRSSAIGTVRHATTTRRNEDQMSDAELPEDFQTAPIGEVDPEIAQVLDRELARQQGTLEMIASENFVPQAVLDAAGSVLTNKYAEGYPGKRYYGGCEEVDVAEEIAIARAKELFGAEHANVQPHAGAQANNAVYTALLQPGDTFLGLALDHGGHLTHGMKLNLSGKLYEPVPYHVDRESLRVDMDEVASLAEEHRPKMIVAGWSAYPRQLDFARFREIADSVGALLMVDMAHFAGLVAAGEHPNPVEYADVTTTTGHKTLCGPRSGMILCREEHAKKINSAIFPGNQGGPLMHAIAAKATAMKIAGTEQFRERQQRTLEGAKILAERLTGGVKVLTGGTDVHRAVDVTVKGLDGSTAEDCLEEIGITVNRNAIPFDERPPMNPSGLRIGTPALTTRGLAGTDEMREIADVICTALSEDFEAERASLRSERRR